MLSLTVLLGLNGANAAALHMGTFQSNAKAAALLGRTLMCNGANAEALHMGTLPKCRKSRCATRLECSYSANAAALLLGTTALLGRNVMSYSAIAAALHWEPF